MLLPARMGVVGRASESRWPRVLGAGAETQWLVGLILLATILRFATLSSQSYWLDESQAVHELRLSFGSMLHAWSANEWNPPLYLIVAWPWAKVFGTGELGLRSLSALLGVAVVPLLYLSGRELVGARAGLVAAALAAVSPFMIWYSQEAREYMLLMALCAASLWAFARAWRAPSRGALLWWAVLSGLALLTQYFAAFLIVAEGLALVYRARSRASVLAVGAMALVLAPLVPHVLPRFQHPAEFIVGIPLSARLQGLPVTFGLGQLYESSLLSYGLLASAALAAAVIVLLVLGAGDAELRGAGIAALLAAVVLVVPLLLALAGHDDYLARGLMPGWLPVAIVLGAACTPRRARAGGAALAVVVLGVSVYALVRVQTESQFQKRDWRGVARALGAPVGPRAIVAYDGAFATGPLSIYLPGVAWAGPGQAPLPASVSVRELDIVGDAGERLARETSATRLIATRTVDGYEVDRFALTVPWTAEPNMIIARATTLLMPAPPGAAVILQGGSK